MASHGYFFPIDDHVLTVKNDNTYYRFQVSAGRLTFNVLYIFTQLTLSTLQIYMAYSRSRKKQCHNFERDKHACQIFLFIWWREDIVSVGGMILWYPYISIHPWFGYNYFLVQSTTKKMLTCPLHWVHRYSNSICYCLELLSTPHNIDI